MRYAIALLLLTLAGCGHAKVVSWEDQDFVVCGNKWCDKECFVKTVKEACDAGWQVKGAYSSSQVTGASSDGQGNYTLNHSNRVCSKVHCMGPLFRAPSSQD